LEVPIYARGWRRRRSMGGWQALLDHLSLPATPVPGTHPVEPPAPVEHAS